jgi:predicted nucleic acid-binding protein
VKRLIVADASPLIALHDGDCIDVLALAFDEVIIPERVFNEVYRRRPRVKPSWVKVRRVEGAPALARIEVLRTERGLDLGESEAIALAEGLELYVLLDEWNARAICRELGVAHISAYHVCHKLHRDGLLKAKRLAEVERALRLHGGFTPDPRDESGIA